jgi:capsule polysaccharide export protein KpsE/RkpR
MSGGFLYPPADPESDCAILFIETSGCLPMCGHGTIGTVTVAVEEGFVPPREPGRLALETPAGRVDVTYTTDGRFVDAVRLFNIPSYLHARDARVEVAGLGEIVFDLAYGGNFYAIIEPQPNWSGLDDMTVADLQRLSPLVRQAAQSALHPVHPEDPRIHGVSHVMWCDRPRNPRAHARNVVFYGEKGIDRFQLQHLYRNRYRVDTAKRLARRTTITEDKKSGVITVEVEDHDPVRARDMAQAYLDELNKLVTQTSTSSAHLERVFIERRLHAVTADLERAQLALSEFSSRNSTIDIKEQTHAMVDAGARVQGELLVAQSGLESLRQIYGDGNVRVHETEARVASLQHDLEKMTGSSAPLIPGAPGGDGGKSDVENKGELYPPLRQLPRLAVPYADLYRQVRVEETVYELLTQQYEMARIDEAKDVPVVSVIDTPGIPEKKSFPPRLLLTLALTFLVFAATAALILIRDYWSKIDPDNPGKMLLAEVLLAARQGARSITTQRVKEVSKL